MRPSISPLARLYPFHRFTFELNVRDFVMVLILCNCCACRSTAHEIPVLAFTTTRWNTLQGGHSGWTNLPPPSTADCISFALAHSAVHHAICSIRNISELSQTMGNLWHGEDSYGDKVATMRRWREYGELVYQQLVHSIDAILQQNKRRSVSSKCFHALQ